MILCLVEHEDGRPSEPSLEALTLGRRLAERFGVPLHGVTVGDDGPAVAGRLGAFGVQVLHAVHLDGPDGFAPGAWARGVLDLIEALAPRAVLAAGTERGNEVMAHVAARADLPMAANCIDVQPAGQDADAGSPFTVTRQRWGGSLLEDAHLDAPVKLLTLTPHAIPAEEAGGDETPRIEELSPALSAADLAVRVTGRVDSGAERVSLGEARVVVGGGRGVGGADGFAALEELADLLGGAVGCSRVATSLGWRPHADQVGQTGTRIAPDLYIACGISGAMQHIVGCKSAKHVLAINIDAEAPMVTRANWAVIGDVHAVLPALVEAIREGRSP